VCPSLASGSCPRNAQRPAGAQAVDQLAFERVPALDEQSLVDRLVADPHGRIIGEVHRQPVGDLLRAPSSRPPAVATVRLVLAVPRRPGGPTTRPSTVRTTPASRSCTYSRSRSFVASVAAFGRRARRSACHCAIDALYSSRHVRVEAFRRSSREIVDGLRPSRRAIARTPRPCARKIVMSSRCPHARRTTDTDPTPPPTDKDSRRQRDGTTGTQPAMTPRLRPRRPRS
jgi:hypothetical protein